jgi:hypothetical protein
MTSLRSSLRCPGLILAVAMDNRLPRTARSVRFPALRPFAPLTHRDPNPTTAEIAPTLPSFVPHSA